MINEKNKVTGLNGAIQRGAGDYSASPLLFY